MRNVKKYVSFLVVFVIAIMMFSSVGFAATMFQTLSPQESGWTRISALNSKMVYSGKCTDYVNGGGAVTGRRVGYGVPGAVKFCFSGTDFRVISYITNASGYSTNVEIKVDGIYDGTYTSNYTTTVYSALTYEKNNLPLGNHIVEITPKDTTTYGTLLFAVDIIGSIRDVPAVLNPASLTATAGNSKVDLSWNLVSDATSYNVKRATTAGGPYTTITTTSAVTYTDNTVTNGTTYYYVVSAVNENGESDNSNEASARPVASDLPSIIEGDRAILAITMVNGVQKEYDMSANEIEAFVNWFDAKDNGVAGTKAYFAINKSYNIKPFLNRKDYVVFSKIQDFEISDYND